jgi:colicin import membrane protein
MELTVTTQEEKVLAVEVFNPSEALKVLNAREAELHLLAEEAKSLSIENAEDKDGYKKVSAHRKRLKTARTSVVNDAENLRDGANKFAKAVIARQKQLVSIVTPEEERLEKEEAKYDAWLESIKIEEERKEKARIQERIDALAKFNHACDLYELTIMEEENFQALLGEAQAAFEKEQERIAAEKAESERQRIAEQERLRVEREELDRQREEFKKREAELKAMREKELAEQRAEQERLRKEHEAKEAALRAEREKLEAEKRAIAEAKAKAEAEERARIEESERQKREILEKEQARIREELERERQEALRPDKEKILNFLDGLISGKTLILETPEGVALMNAFSDQLRSLIADFKDNLNQL